MIRYNNICVINNTHGLLIYFLKYPDKFPDTLFICQDDFPPTIRSNFKHVIVMPSFNKDRKFLAIIKRVFYRAHMHCSKFWYLKRYSKKICGHDHLYFSGSFLSKNFICLEDGTANYLTKHRKLTKMKSFLREKILGVSSDIYGYSDKISKIILSGMMDIPAGLATKAEVLDISKEWKACSAPQRKHFLSIFNMDEDLPTKKVMIITQPFSEDGYITETEKLKIYQSLLSFYTKTYDISEICIKPHPRESTNYSSHFSCTVIDSPVPAQVLVIEMGTEVIATLYSSAGYLSHQGCTVHLFGTSPSETLSNKVGDIPGNVTL
ncbi:glycosyltransferase family 52 [Cronobacter turicensis]